MDAEGSKPVPTPTTPVATVGEAFDTMVEASGIVKANAEKITESAYFLEKMAHAFARVGIPVVVGLVFVVAFLIFQIELRDDKIETLDRNLVELKGTVKSLESSSAETRDAAVQAKSAASSAQASLDAAIANSQAQQQGSNDAIARINDIYDTCVIKKEC